MSQFDTQPRIDQPVVDQLGRITRPWRDYLASLWLGQDATQLQEFVNVLAERIAQLEGTFSLKIIGPQSIQVQGAPSSGVVILSLDGDNDTPGNTEYYGTGPDGKKGFFPVADSIQVDDGELERVIGLDGVVTLGLANLPDAGGGALKKIMRDSFGRVAGTSDPTTTDLPEGSNLYYTNARVDARIAAAGGLQIGEILVADGVSPPVMLTDEAETDFLYQG